MIFVVIAFGFDRFRNRDGILVVSNRDSQDVVPVGQIFEVEEEVFTSMKDAKAYAARFPRASITRIY